MKYARLLTRLEGACLLMSEAKLRLITEKVTIPLFFDDVESLDKAPRNSLRVYRDRPDNPHPIGSPRLGTIEVYDSLVSKDASAASGMTSYQDISMQIDRAIAGGYTQLVFDVDSPGGEASGLFSLTDKIRGLKAKGIQTIGYVDGFATSAAYAILAACQTVYATETSIVGSIAALMVHVDASEKDKMDGKKYTIFRSKEKKALGDSHTPLTEAANDKIKSLLDTMDTAFNNDVSKSRGIPTDKIIDFKGSEFMAIEARKLGLVDFIVSGLEETMKLSTNSPKQSKGGHMTLEEAEAKIVSLEAEKVELAATIADLSAKLESTDNKVSADNSCHIAEALSAQKTEFSSLLTVAATLRMDVGTVSEILAESPSIPMAVTTMKQVAKFSAPIISGATGIQPTVILSEEDAASEERKSAALAAYNKAMGVTK